MKGEFLISMHRSEQKPGRLLSPSINEAPRNPHHIHLMGICGTGMASLAGMLKEKGYQVTGSDQNIYPPMSHFLEKLSIPVLKGYNEKNLHLQPDLVIVGNVITKENPEAVELARLHIPYLSLPQALRHFAVKGKRSIVICGTHGKTTTSSLVAWILENAGLQPSFMIGGIPLNFHTNFKLGKGKFFVIEGDEYDTAFFDKGPKFLHYDPFFTILTGIEFDHADIYRDLEHVMESFRKLMDIIPREGALIANKDNPNLVSEINRAKCAVHTYGFSHNALWKGVEGINQGDFSSVKVSKGKNGPVPPGTESFTLLTRLYGRHNMENLLAAVVLARLIDIPSQTIARAVKKFRGVKRRQEIIADKRGILVLDDFAHHPTAVGETTAAVKAKYKNRRLIAVFEPRSNSSRRNIFQTRYARSFDDADLIFIPDPPLMGKIPLQERFSSKRLAKDLEKKGLEARYFSDTATLLQALLDTAREGDVILFMSNGSFDNLQQQLIDGL